VPLPTDDADTAEDLVPGENFRLSRVTRHDAGPVYVWPSKAGACFSAEGVSSCADASDIAERDVIVSLYRGAAAPEGATRVAGIARDGVEEVSITLSAGDRVNVPVADNAFVVDVDGEPRTIEWTGPSGPRTERLPG
jgi:hypothetical protein